MEEPSIRSSSDIRTVFEGTLNVIHSALVSYYRLTENEASGAEEDLLMWFQRLARRGGSGQMPAKLMRLSLLSAACQYGRSFQLWKLGGEQSPDRGPERSARARARRRGERSRPAVRARRDRDRKGHPLPATAALLGGGSGRRDEGAGDADRRPLRARRGPAARGPGDAAVPVQPAAPPAGIGAGRRARRGRVPVPVHREPPARDRPLRRTGVLPGRDGAARRHGLPPALPPRGSPRLVRPRRGGLPAHGQRGRRSLAPGLPAPGRDASRSARSTWSSRCSRRSSRASAASRCATTPSSAGPSRGWR